VTRPAGPTRSIRPPAPSRRRAPACGRPRARGGSGCEVERPVAVEEVAGQQSAARGELGDGLIGCRELEGAGAPAVDELERRDVAQRRHDLGAALEQLAGRPALHPPDHAVARAGVVALTGDLRLVHHEADESESRAGGDASAERGDLAGLVHGRTEDADVAEARCTPRGVGVDGHADLRSGAWCRHGVDEVELGEVVDHEGDSSRRPLVRRERRDGRAVGGRIPHDDVIVRLGQPERLRQGEGEDALIARHRQGRIDRLAHAHGLARHADRHPAGAHDHVEGVVAQGGKAQGGDRTRDVADGVRQTAPERCRVLPRLGRDGR
jgi:hypothetical protein